jgi:polar amino acid transport system substrate-binding protein
VLCVKLTLRRADPSQWLNPIQTGVLMYEVLSRRHVAFGLAASATFAPMWASAQDATPGGLLARLRAAGKARIGIANQPPFSGIDPTGKLIGLTPTVVTHIMAKLGVPAIEGVIASYGELVPGMQAGRWDFIGAALTITKERCTQVLFTDPIAFDGGALVTLKGAFAEPPKLVADIAKRNLLVGIQTGGTHARLLPTLGVPAENIQQYNSDISILDALVAKRIQVAFGSSSGLKNAYRQRGLPVEIAYPVADDPAHGSACAFRSADAELRDLFTGELRALKASGEYQKLAQPYGFDMPAELVGVTAEQACTGKI